MTRPPRIRLVVLLEDLAFGGTQRYAVHLLTHLDRSWFAPEVWVLRGGDDLEAKMRAAGVPVVRLSGGRRVGPLALGRLALRLWRHNPDLLYTLTVLPNIWGRAFAGLMRIPVVSGYRSFMPRQHERLLHRFSARIIANAAVLKELMIARWRIEPDRIAVVPNGVDGEHFSPAGRVGSADPLAVCVARLVREKDIPTLLEAFRRTRQRWPAARLEIVGDGPLRFPAPPNVHFVPGTEDVRSHLRRAHVFVLSSASEASPNVVIEAMACGIPVVATRVGGIPELVEHGKTGLLVPPGDPAALAAALTLLLGDEAKQRAFGDRGRRRALAEFSVAGMVRRTENVLREVAQRGSAWTVNDDGEVPVEVALRPAARSVSRPERIIERGTFRPDRSLREVVEAAVTVHLPPASRACGTAAVICPGGGYAGVTIDKEGHDVARWLTTLGVAGLVLKYRLPRPDVAAGGTPWPLEDVVGALRLARDHAGTWHIDPRRIGVMGFSAGGHMAGWASAVDRVAFAVLIYPVISMRPELAHKGSRLRRLGPRPAAEMLERYSLETRVTPQTSPTLLIHAQDDHVVKVANSTVYGRALHDAGVPHEFLHYGAGGHGFGLGNNGGEVAEWPGRSADWLRRLGFLS